MSANYRLGFACALAIASCAGPTYDTSAPFNGDPPAVYVAKIKQILLGLPPTAAEVAAIEKDPTQLKSYVQQWMGMPQYQQKMQVFFELAFQQTQITDTDFVNVNPPDGFGNGTNLRVELLQNIRESFARTMVSMIASNQPLTNAFTTHSVMMTPALRQAYAFLDAHPTDDNGKTTDAFATANAGKMITLESSQGPIPITQSVDPTSPNYLTFYDPDLPTLTNYPDSSCDAMDPVTFKANSLALMEVMYGVVPSHVSATNATCAVKAGKTLQLQPSDFTSWEMVEVRTPTSGSDTPTSFLDLPAMRTGNTLVLNTPHVGFFSTPAFEANWPTNASNQMRVTTNQALIVATGTAIDGTDPTIPPTTPGLDSQHAAPGTACFGCHQLLDPTRSIFSSTYSWFYNPQTDPTLTSQPGLFAFQGVIKPMKTLDDFATILAQHPLVPAAWAQKLCYYANSAPCDPTDPVFQQIVADFGKGMSWNTLVAELMSSPIVTNAQESQTHITNGEVIAVTRRDHMCAALNNRLGFVDICQLDAIDQVGPPTVIAQIMAGMPSDGYGRGSTIPVLPNQPTLFYRAGAENVCIQVAAQVIDATNDPNQPGVKHWSSAQPAAAIADFVSLMMGLVGDDPRAATANAALTAHFTSAQATGASATDALRSTFVVACLSPSFIGIGM